MTNEELVALCKDGDRDAVLLLIQKNSGAIYRISRKFAGTNYTDMDDCLQESALCVIDCVRLFDPSHNVKFITYLYRSLLSRLSRWRLLQRIIHVPIAQDREVRDRFVPGSLDCGDDSGRRSLKDALKDKSIPPSEIVAARENARLWSQKLARLMAATLTERQIAVLWSRANGECIREIADRYGVSCQAIQQTEANAMRLLGAEKSIFAASAS